MALLDGAIIDTIWNKIVDKGMTIVFLCVALYFMHRKESELQDKMDAIQAKFDKYQEVDRKMMFDLIQNNTTAINNFTVMSTKKK